MHHSRKVTRIRPYDIDRSPSFFVNDVDIYKKWQRPDYIMWIYFHRFLWIYTSYKSDGGQTTFSKQMTDTRLYHIVWFPFFWNVYFTYKKLWTLYLYKKITDTRIYIIVWFSSFVHFQSLLALNDGNWFIINEVWYPSLFTCASLIVHNMFTDCKHSWLIV